jgi:hypothetical protein
MYRFSGTATCLAILFIYACSSESPVLPGDPSVSDASSSFDAVLGESDRGVDASEMTDASDAAHDASDGTVHVCPFYSGTSNPSTDAFFYRHHDEECDISCGAIGQYSYDTETVDVRPSLAVCNQQFDSEGNKIARYCCTALTCVRDKRVPFDQGCAAGNTGHDFAFFCGGPEGRKPTRAGCAPYPETGSVYRDEVCCSTE